MAPAAFSQVPFRQSDESSYNLGLQSFKQGDYSTAYLYFKQVIGDSLNQRSAQSFYYGARCLFNLHRYQEACVTIDSFLARFPSDDHKFEMVYLLGANYFELGKYTTAASDFIVAVDSAYDPTVRDRAAASLRSITDSNLNFDEIESAFSLCHTRLSASTLAIGFARRAYTSDRLSNAQKILRLFASRYPGEGIGSVDVSRWLDRIAQDSALGNTQFKIGVLLPLEYGSGVGDKLLLGIQLALDNYNATAQNKIGISLKNYGGNVVNLVSGMRSFAKNDYVKAVIGPVFSSEVTQVIPIANSAGLPTITPTATQVGLATANSYVFQTNPNYMTRAEAVADYAVHALHLHRIAILSPSDSYGKTIAGYFAERLAADSVKVVSTQYFESGTTDLAQQILAIKQAAADSGEPYVDFTLLNRQQQAKLTAFGIPSAYVDSVTDSRGSLDAYDLLGPYPQHIADSLGIPLVKRDTLGQFDALRSLDGIFIPLTSSSDIGVVGAQLAFYNVKTQILGTDDWYDLNQLSNNYLYDDGVIFCSDTYFNSTSPAFISASDSLSGISDVDLDRTVAYGYDVTNLLLSAFRDGGDSRPGIYNALRTETFTGLHAMIYLGGDNSNHYLHMLQYKKGTIIDLGQVNPN